MDYPKFARSIITMRNSDFKFREKLIVNGKLSEGYNPEMEKLHLKNAELLEVIIDEIGYPTIDKVGSEASEAAWFIIQHSISKPAFMKKCVLLLEKEVLKNKASKKNYAYLIDRIAVFEGNLQLYGTQFDWDLNGELIPNDFDDLEKVNQRRQKIGLNSLEEQTKLIQKQAREENQTAPKNLFNRKVEYDLWRKKVGWIISLILLI